MEGAVPGKAGWVRVAYWPAESTEADALKTPIKQVEAGTDFTHQVALRDLRPDTRYRYRFEAGQPGNDTVAATAYGSFKTAPDAAASAKVTFTVANCQDYARRDDPANGHKIYPQMGALHPDFFIHTGDLEYYDKPSPLATTVALARFKWNRIFALPFQRAFHREISNYFMKDDHDTLKDDAWMGQVYGELTWDQGLALFREQVPIGEKPYRTIRWGKHVQIWLVEGREFRSPNDMPDGPEKSIWGAEQKKWFYETVKNSDATFRVLISPTPIEGPDRDTKGDNHSNKAFAHEGAELRQFIASQKNMVIVCGDRHWQYASVDPETGLREYSAGPSSDAHASGFSEADRSAPHRFLRIKGGFLSVTVEPSASGARAIFRHYDVDGKIQYEDVLTAP
ncbi:alkaline phosphatase [Nibricoccus aquaticus]|uniref:Alkaline phosphatase n=2 Tax=Nibricoccus aquaticus TaxID=2576891 RepID=A0A290QDB3_9BACT|nr:alkaline phosphatase [Nibricoccus aquaticus]